MQFHRLAQLFPPIEGEAYENLLSDIRANGLIEPIWTYQGEILDGKNRYRACQDARIEPSYREYQGDSPAAFVVSANIQRRDLTASQKAMLALVLMPELEAEAKERQLRKPMNSVVEKFPQQNRGPLARDEAARAVGVNPHYVQDAKAIQETDPVLADRVRAGSVTISDAKAELRKKQRKETREKEAAEAPLATRWDGAFEVGNVYVADATDRAFLRAVPEASVDMVISDPPWAEDSAPQTYEALGRFALRALKPGGICVAYCGTMFLPDELHVLTQHLDYVWTVGIFQPDSNTKIQRWHLFSSWRPIVLLKKPGERLDMPWIPDSMRSTRSKKHHPWEQGIEPALKLIEAYTVRGELVADPFVGGGTFVAAAQRLGRDWIGFDIDEKTAKLAQKRARQ